MGDMTDWVQVTALGVLAYFLRDIAPALRENTRMMGQMKEVVDDWEKLKKQEGKE